MIRSRALSAEDAAEDAAWVAPLLAEMERHYEGEAAIGEDLVEVRTRAALARFTPELALFFAAEGMAAPNAGAPLGFAAALRQWPGKDAEHMWFLKELYVARAARGRGIGAGLVAAIASAIRAQGDDRLDLTVEPGADRAAAFYRRLGAVETGKTYLRFPIEALETLAERTSRNA